MKSFRVVTEQVGHVWHMSLNRPEKQNAADQQMLDELSAAFTELDRNPELRVGLVSAAGKNFTAGLDLDDVLPRLGRGEHLTTADGGLDPWAVQTRPVRKPVVMAVQGTCLTLGIELILATDICVASKSSKFGQIEVSRGILPFGGATLRFPQRVGWGNAMRWMLTSEIFGADEAMRIGLVQDVVEDGAELERAFEIADRIASQAPLAVEATLANSRLAQHASVGESRVHLSSELNRLLSSKDVEIGFQAFRRREKAVFEGH